jgi:SAM-dependent methyltransferase
MLIAALTILLSSFLLFLVQPIVAKQILPWFGGSAGVWTMCLVFFQLVLLFGYTYAHWLTRHGVRPRRSGLHIVLLIASCLTLPIIPSSFWQPQHDTEPVLRILGLLTATVGLPYFLLASTAPLLQRWLSAHEQSSAQSRSIYRLFALSNFGSLVGLLSYPFTIEPFATLRLQAWVWSSAYVLFVGCFISYAWKRRRSADLPHAAADDGGSGEPAPAPRTYAYWIGCAALGSALLLSVTNQITQNVAAIPFLWVAPLSMYLLSFIICFEGRSGQGSYDRRRSMAPAMLATVAMAWALFADKSNLSILSAVPIFVIGILWGCIVCHGELARSKPSPAYLTNFYLSLATGGALGGLLVGVIAPVIFDSYWEMPLALIAVAILGVYGCSRETQLRPRTLWTANLAIASLGTALVLFLLLGDLPSALDSYALALRCSGAALLIVAAFLLQRSRFSLAIALTALCCTLIFDWSYYQELTTGAKYAARNFYGSLRVIDSMEGPRHIRRLKHGVIVHGSQILEPAESAIPTTYYGETSGIGRTLLSERRTIGALRIGSVGLGAGTLAAYGETGDLFRVYELNPAVLDIAQNQFSYLKNSKARIEPVLGDARLSLAFEIAHGAFDAPGQRFDVLSLDAFSGDAIPVHLLTREAFATYARAIKPEGIIAFHLSNQYLDLPPIVQQIARSAGFQAVLIADRPPASSLTAASDWVLVTRNAAFLRQPEISAHAAPITARADLPEWTDQFSNLFQILK